MILFGTDIAQRKSKLYRPKFEPSMIRATIAYACVNGLPLFSASTHISAVAGFQTKSRINYRNANLFASQQFRKPASAKAERRANAKARHFPLTRAVKDESRDDVKEETSVAEKSENADVIVASLLEDPSLMSASDDSVQTAGITGAIVGQDPISAAKAAAATAVTVADRGENVLTEVEPRPSAIGTELARIYDSCQTWSWQGHQVNYVKQGKGPALVLVHGFGASIGHFRKNIPVLAETHTVFALDLLGQGGSSKPPKFVYTIETWAELVLDFLAEVVKEPAVLLGNSIGSLTVLLASADAPQGAVRGTVLLNCAGGMNNKAITDDWRIRAALPLFWLIDWLLLQPALARPLFNRVKSRDNVKTVLQSVYSNKEAVDDELVEVILKPADTEGALDAFVAIITGPPGPRPEMLVPKISHPILLLWGDEDPFTPFDGPIGKYFRDLPNKVSNVQFVELASVGHCPHDDRPDLVHEALLPWLATVNSPVLVN